MTTPPLWTMDANGRMVYTASGDNEPTLTPGAYLAKQRGCTCSRLDNDWGQGREVITPTEVGDGSVYLDWEFVITPGCPLHDNRVESDLDSKDQRSGDNLPGSAELDNSDAVDNSRQG